MKQIATISQNSCMGLDAEQVWNTELAYAHLQQLGQADTKRTAERRLQFLKFLPSELTAQILRDELDRPPNGLVLDWALAQARKKRARVLFVQLALLPNGKPCLHANDARGARLWLPLPAQDADTVWQALTRLQQYIDKPIAVFPHGPLVRALREQRSTTTVSVYPQAYRPVLERPLLASSPRRQKPLISPALKCLEAESLHILREAVADAHKPVMFYSADKDSSVMLHLARKAFFPAMPPFPLLHVDTRWKFQELYLFRDFIARESRMDLLIQTTPEALEKHINAFDHSAALYTKSTQTEGLKQALEHYKFDLVLKGYHCDEEKSHAQTRAISLRDPTHDWDLTHQAPKLWNLHNTYINPGQSLQVCALSNWTELDTWQYIYQENIPVAPLYFAKPRPVVMRANTWVMLDDERCRLLPGEKIQIRQVRFRKLDCYPLASAFESDAQTSEDILLELVNMRQSERQRHTTGNSSPVESVPQKKGYS